MLNFCDSIDILTPLPALGVDFTIIEKKGPKILNPIKTQADVDNLKPMHDVATQVPFLGPILQVILGYVSKIIVVNANSSVVSLIIGIAKRN